MRTRRKAAGSRQEEVGCKWEIATIQSHPQLDAIREEIDSVDDSLSSLISRRVQLVRKVADIKAEFGLSTLDTERERLIIERVLGNAPDAASAEAIKTIYDVLFQLSRDYQTVRKTDLGSQNRK
jgi:chorismate mutase